MNGFRGQFKRDQQGLSLLALASLGIAFALTAILAAKCFPAITEYYSIIKEVKATAQDPSLKGNSVSDYRAAFAKRADIAYIKAVKSEDLEITKENDTVVIGFEYTEKIPLFWKASILFEFDGSSQN